MPVLKGVGPGRRGQKGVKRGGKTDEIKGGRHHQGSLEHSQERPQRARDFQKTKGGGFRKIKEERAIRDNPFRYSGQKSIRGPKSTFRNVVTSALHWCYRVGGVISEKVGAADMRFGELARGKGRDMALHHQSPEHRTPESFQGWAGGWGALTWVPLRRETDWRYSQIRLLPGERENEMQYMDMRFVSYEWGYGPPE